MNAAELAAKIAENYEVARGLYAHHCQTGDAYVIIGEDMHANAEIPGTVDEGQQLLHYTDEPQACEAALRAFNCYAEWWHFHNAGVTPKLYWRYAAPHAFWHDDDGTVRVRLVLSAAPVKFETLEEYDVWRREELREKLIGDLESMVTHELRE